MIDVIINEHGGLTVAHDEKSLDGYEALEVSADGSAVLVGPAGARAIGTLLPSMLEAVTDGMVGRMVRVSGWSLAKISPLVIRIR